MSVQYSRWLLNISAFSTLRPSKIYPDWDFWFENKPSGNPAPLPQAELPFPTFLVLFFVTIVWYFIVVVVVVVVVVVFSHKRNNFCDVISISKKPETLPNSARLNSLKRLRLKLLVHL
jgi:hypothetical protein